MQTRLLESIRATSDGQEADRILRACVHCGFCTATCPTYQLLGDELDGPRGRIYQIKNLLEGEAPTRSVQRHLDRCLTCLNCETTCPSGVSYHHLLDIGRRQLEQQLPRPATERLQRWLLCQTIPYPRRFGWSLRIGQMVRPLLPARLQAKIPSKPTVDPIRVPKTSPAKHQGSVAVTTHTSADAPSSVDTNPQTSVILLRNCVEPLLTPEVQSAMQRILANLGIWIMQPAKSGCCGAVPQHLAAEAQAKTLIRRNIDAWWPLIEPKHPDQPPIEAILSSASGCGAMLKDYGWLLRDDPHYAERAARISALARDPVEYLSHQALTALGNPIKRGLPVRISFHVPCSLQHAQGLAGRVEGLLRSAGFELLPVTDSHSCCGSAGTYSLLQPELSERLREDRLRALESAKPALIATANVGCQTHLQAGTRVPVVHWLQLFDPESTPSMLGLQGNNSAH